MMLFFACFSINPIPSSTFVISYILLFCTSSKSAALFRLRIPLGELLKTLTNLLVSIPNDVSNLCFSGGDFTEKMEQ